MTNPQPGNAFPVGHWCLVIGHLLVIEAWSLGFWHRGSAHLNSTAPARWSSVRYNKADERPPRPPDSPPPAAAGGASSAPPAGHAAPPRRDRAGVRARGVRRAAGSAVD